MEVRHTPDISILLFIRLLSFLFLLFLITMCFPGNSVRLMWVTVLSLVLRLQKKTLSDLDCLLCETMTAASGTDKII